MSPPSLFCYNGSRFFCFRWKNLLGKNVLEKNMKSFEANRKPLLAFAAALLTAVASAQDAPVVPPAIPPALPIYVYFTSL